MLAQLDSAEMGELPLADWDYQRPKRGQVRSGVILAIHDQEIIVDVDAKRDGVVPYADMQRLGEEEVAKLAVGDKVPVYVLRPEDREGNLLVSLFQAQQARAWLRAAELAESGEAWEGEVIGYNKGGLLVPLDNLRGFIPASQVPGFPQGLNQEERLTKLASMVGETLTVKVIEINRRNRRLILSATAARRQWRKRQRERLLEELREGEVRKGTVSSLAAFGAFVDLGGADGLIHVSELSWRRVRHPREVLTIGDKVEVYVLRLDEERNRIGLSLKRLQPEPWSLVEDKYELGQLVEGVVTNVVDFGAFAEIEAGVEGLIHVSELAEGQISHPRDVVRQSDLLLLRIIRIDMRRKRLGLSLKRVLESEWAEWAAHLAKEEAKKQAEKEAAEEPEVDEQEQPAPELAADTDAVEPEGESVEQPIAEAVEEQEQPAPELAADTDAVEPEGESVEQPVAEAVEEQEQPVHDLAADTGAVEPEGESVEQPIAEAVEEQEQAVPELAADTDAVEPEGEPVEQPIAEAVEEQEQPVPELAADTEAVEVEGEPVEQPIAEAVEEQEQAVPELVADTDAVEPEGESFEQPFAEAVEEQEQPVPELAVDTDAVEPEGEPVEQPIAEVVEEQEQPVHDLAADTDAVEPEGEPAEQPIAEAVEEDAQIEELVALTADDDQQAQDLVETQEVEEPALAPMAM